MVTELRNSGVDCSQTSVVPLSVVPDCVSVTRSQNCAVPLPDRMYVVAGQLVAALIRKAYTPLSESQV